MDGRKQNGQFDSGNRLQRNGGRKPRTGEQEIKTALAQAKPRVRVLEKLAEAIERREAWAIQLYFAYDWGKPLERHEITGAEGEPLAIRIDATGLHPLD